MTCKRKIKKAFEYWQNKAPVHPLTCNNGCGNLNLEFIDKNNILHLECPCCDYKQEYIPEIILNYYNCYLKQRTLKIKPFFRWYDLWIGVFIDTKNDVLYIIPFPMIGIKLYWKPLGIFDML